MPTRKKKTQPERVAPEPNAQPEWMNPPTEPFSVRYGRPPKYKPEYVDMIIKFFDRPLYETYETMFGPKRIANPTPFFYEFAERIGCGEDTLIEWANLKKKGTDELKYPSFAEAYKICHKKQERFMVANGSMNLHNATITVFALKNMSGWRDVKDMNITEHNLVDLGDDDETDDEK